jgi:hypothetical protein
MGRSALTGDLTVFFPIYRDFQRQNMGSIVGIVDK